MVATLLANAILTPEGKPEAEADIEPVQIGVAVYTISVIAVFLLLFVKLEPVVSATVNSLPHNGLLAFVSAEVEENNAGSAEIPETHQPDKS